MKQLRYKRQSGVALVEFTLVAPLLLVLIFITTEFGRAYYQYDTIAKSVREAARYLSVRSAGVDVDKATNIVVYGNTAGTGSPIVTGLSASKVSIPARGTLGSNPTMNTVTVIVSGVTFTPIVGSVFGFALNSFTFGPIHATMRSPA